MRRTMREMRKVLPRTRIAIAIRARAEPSVVHVGYIWQDMNNFYMVRCTREGFRPKEVYEDTTAAVNCLECLLRSLETPL